MCFLMWLILHASLLVRKNLSLVIPLISFRLSGMAARFSGLQHTCWWGGSRAAFCCFSCSEFVGRPASPPSAFCGISCHYPWGTRNKCPAFIMFTQQMFTFHGFRALVHLNTFPRAEVWNRKLKLLKTEIGNRFLISEVPLSRLEAEPAPNIVAEKPRCGCPVSFAVCGHLSSADKMHSLGINWSGDSRWKWEMHSGRPSSSTLSAWVGSTSAAPGSIRPQPPGATCSGHQLSVLPVATDRGAQRPPSFLLHFLSPVLQASREFSEVGDICTHFISRERQLQLPAGQTAPQTFSIP